MPTLPPIVFPLIGNSIAVGLFSLLHIALAGLSMGFMVLTPFFEWYGRMNTAALELAHSLTRFTVIVFSASTVLAVIMVELLIGLFPVTTMWIWNQFRTPIAVSIAAFILQLLALYPYYHYWDVIRKARPSFHLFLGISAALFMLVWVVVLDGMGSYMLTPVAGRSSWSNLWNPTWLPLVLHRLIGDVMVAGYVIAAYGAWRTGRPADKPALSYYTYLVWTGWIIGLGALLLQPFSGLLYAWSIQSSVPESYEQLVRGRYQILVYLQFLLIGLMFVGNHIVLRDIAAVRSKWIDGVVFVSAIALVGSVGYTGVRRSILYLLVILMLWPLTRRRMPALTVDSSIGAGLRPALIALGCVSLLIYLTMGTIRETARRPDTIRNMISLQDEARHPAAFRGGNGSADDPARD